MRKYLLLSLIVAVLNSYSYRTISRPNSTVFDKWAVGSNILNKIEGKYDKEKDITVISKEVNIEMHDYTNVALEDATSGLKKLIYDYAYSELTHYLSRANLIGPGFNEITFSKFANNIAEELIKEKKYEINGEWVSDSSNTYFVLVKIDKEIVKKEAKKIFSERLEVVIDVLNELNGSLK